MFKPSLDKLSNTIFQIWFYPGFFTYLNNYNKKMISIILPFLNKKKGDLELGVLSFAEIIKPAMDNNIADYKNKNKQLKFECDHMPHHYNYLYKQDIEKNNILIKEASNTYRLAKEFDKREIFTRQGDIFYEKATAKLEKIIEIRDSLLANPLFEITPQQAAAWNFRTEQYIFIHKYLIEDLCHQHVIFINLVRIRQMRLKLIEEEAVIDQLVNLTVVDYNVHLPLDVILHIIINGPV